MPGEVGAHSLNNKRGIVLGVHSGAVPGVYTGIQHIVRHLSARGAEIDYFPVGSSFLDAFFPSRFQRFKKAWVESGSGQGDCSGVAEHVVRQPCPMHRLFVRHRSMLKLFQLFAPKWLGQKQYDFCISDVSPNLVYLPQIRAHKKILRLNDLPEGFSHVLPEVFVRHIYDLIANGEFSSVLPVSDYLTSYVKGKCSPETIVEFIPNGCDVREAAAGMTTKMPKSVVYIGAQEAWVDLELLNATARLMPDWIFHLYGPFKAGGHPPNVVCNGVLERGRVVNALARYEVGLIPFKDISGRMISVEKPLKFFDYLAAGLGIASTDVGSLRKGMGKWANYGSTPAAFAQAILDAATRKSPDEERRVFLRRYHWDAICDKIVPHLTGSIS